MVNFHYLTLNVFFKYISNFNSYAKRYYLRISNKIRAK